MATVYRMVKETTPQGKTRWVRCRDPKDRRPGTWFLAYARDGKQVKEATDATTKAQAEALLSMRKVANHKAEVMGVRAESVDMTYGKFLRDTYLPMVQQTIRPSTYESYEIHADILEGALGGLLLRKITRGDVQQFISDRLKNGKTKRGKAFAPATINRSIALIRSSLYAALARELIDRNPAARIELLSEENERTRVMTGAEEKKLLETAPEWLIPIIKVAVLAGLRQGEILGLKWKETAGAKDNYVDLERKLIHISPEAKDHEARNVPITPALKTIFDGITRGIRDGQKVPWVFFDPGTGEKIDPHAVRGCWRRAVRRAKLKDLRFHDLRRSFASRLAERGVSLQKIAKLLGHGSTYVTERYSHLSDDGLEKAVALLSEVATG